MVIEKYKLCNKKTNLCDFHGPEKKTCLERFPFGVSVGLQ